MDHATVKIDKYVIPLIGVPRDATLGQCDCCHDDFHVQDLKLNEAGNQFLCRKCRHDESLKCPN